MKRNNLIIGIVLLVVGIIGRVYGSMSEYVDDTGMLHETAWIPVGTLLIVIGAIVLLVWGVRAWMGKGTNSDV